MLLNSKPVTKPPDFSIVDSACRRFVGANEAAR